MNVRKRSGGGGSNSHIKGAVSSASSSGGGGVKAIRNSVAVKAARSVKVKGAVALRG